MMADQVRKAVVTAVGLDKKGIIANVSRVLFEKQCNIMEIATTVLEGYFSMVVICDLSEMTEEFESLQKALCALGEELGLDIRVKEDAYFSKLRQALEK